MVIVSIVCIMAILSMIANLCIIVRDLITRYCMLKLSQRVLASPWNLIPLPCMPLNHASVMVKYNLLLMTCQVLIEIPRGSIKVRALLDSASSACFISERIAQTLCLQERQSYENMVTQGSHVRIGGRGEKKTEY